MKREKQLTKRERKAQTGAPAGGHQHGNDHIHCISCGRHLDIQEFDDPATATAITCNHGSTFPSCIGCQVAARALIAEHDRTNQPVKTAPIWH